ncbi:IS110 family transposase, partial [Klebsiella michiganensis]|nr:IS110 family transposase [Klebsiella michiganensis]
MENIALIGIDLGKNSFHIHCQDRRGKAVFLKKLNRSTYN